MKGEQLKQTRQSWPVIDCGRGLRLPKHHRRLKFEEVKAGGGNPLFREKSDKTMFMKTRFAKVGVEKHEGPGRSPELKPTQQL